MEPLVLVPLLFTLGGIALAIYGIRSYRAGARFEQRALRAPGVVIDLHTSHGANSGAIDFPVVRFEAAGRELETRVMYGSRPAPAKVGEHVTVLYDPENPTRAVLPGMFGSGRALAGILIAVGFAIALLGLALGAGALVVSSL